MIKRYLPEYFDHIEGLFKSRNQEIKREQLPSMGFFTENAACFLITTNCQICFLEFLISRPVEGRDEELDQCVVQCLNLASTMGYKVCYALTEKTKVVERALKHSFEITKQKVLMVRRLSWDL